jgi:hypothetical protein
MAVNGLAFGNSVVFPSIRFAGQDSRVTSDSGDGLVLPSRPALTGDTVTLSNNPLHGQHGIRPLTAKQLEALKKLEVRALKQQAQAQAIMQAKQKTDATMEALGDFLKGFKPYNPMASKTLPSAMQGVVNKRLDMMGKLQKQLADQYIPLIVQSGIITEMGTALLNPKSTPENVDATLTTMETMAEQPDNHFKPETLQKLDKAMSGFARQLDNDVSMIVTATMLDEKLVALKQQTPKMPEAMIKKLEKLQTLYNDHFEQSAEQLDTLGNLPNLIFATDPAVAETPDLPDMDAAQLADTIKTTQAKAKDTQKAIIEKLQQQLTDISAERAKLAEQAQALGPQADTNDEAKQKLLDIGEQDNTYALVQQDLEWSLTTFVQAQEAKADDEQPTER